MQKTIGIDLDEVLSETLNGVLKFHNYKINGKPAYRKDISHYYLWDIKKYKLSKDEGIKYFNTFLYDTETYDNILPVQGAKEGLKKLKDAGWKIIIITARKEELKEITLHRLHKYFAGMRDDIVFANHFSKKEVHKSQICKQKNIDIMIEDNGDYAKELAENGISVYLLAKPWNKKYKNGMVPNIMKVSGRDKIAI